MRNNNRTDRYNVDQFVQELRRIVQLIPVDLDDPDVGEEARQAIQDLYQSLLIDDADCGCQVEIAFKQKNLTIDANPECEDHAEGKVDKSIVEDAVDQLREGKHLISCVPGDGYCRCAVEIVEGVLA